MTYKELSESRADYSSWTDVTLRFGDTDALGHVNNAAFAAFLESGRIRLLLDEGGWLDTSGTYWVIANLNINFRAEINYPGTVSVGTSIDSFGTTSLKLRQIIFQGDKCCCTSTSVIVLMDSQTKRGASIDASLKQLIEKRAQINYT